MYPAAIQKLIQKLIGEKVKVIRTNGNITDEIVSPKQAERLVIKCEKVYESNGKLVVQMPTAWYEFQNAALANA